jgi:hypothetical protein
MSDWISVPSVLHSIKIQIALNGQNNCTIFLRIWEGFFP